MSTVESSARGRDANTAYLYERIAEGDHEHAEQPDSPHVMRRGTSHDAAQLVRGIIAARDDRARTAHQVAASTDREGDLPDRVRSLSDRRAHAVQSRRTAYRHWHEETQELVAERQRWIDQHIGRDRSQDQGPRLRHRPLAVQAFDRTAFLPRPLDGWAPVSRLREG